MAENEKNIKASEPRVEQPKNQTPHATSREQINSDIKSMSTEDLLKLAYPGAK